MSKHSNNNVIIIYMPAYGVAWKNCISYKKLKNILKLQTTITFEMKHI